MRYRVFAGLSVVCGVVLIVAMLFDSRDQEILSSKDEYSHKAPPEERIAQSHLEESGGKVQAATGGESIGTSLPVKQNDLITRFRASRNLRVEAQDAINSGSLGGLEVGIAYYIACAAVTGGSAVALEARSAGVLKPAHDLKTACLNFDGDVQMAQALVSHRERLRASEEGGKDVASRLATLRRMAREGNGDALILEAASGPFELLFTLLGVPWEDSVEGRRAAQKKASTLLLALEGATCAQLGCDLRLRMVAHCRFDWALCESGNLESRLEQIATRLNGVDARTWQSLRSSASAAVVRLKHG